MRDRGRRHRRDGGVVARARPAPRRRHALRRGRLHEPHARAPRLPPDASTRTSRPRRALFDPRFSVARRDQHRRPVRRRARATAPIERGLQVCTYSIDDADRRRLRAATCCCGATRRCSISSTPATTTTAWCAARSSGSFNVANALAAAATALVVGLLVRGRARRARRAGARARAGSNGSATGRDFAVLVDYAHTPDALASVLGAARSLVDGGQARRRVRVRRRPRPFEAAADGRGRDPARRRRRSSPPTTRAPRIPTRSPRDVLDGVPADRDAPDGRARPARARSAPRCGGAARATSS